MANYYEILGLRESASSDEIKKAYRILAKKFHPDLNKEEDATEKFIALEEAYSCLSKNDSKTAYDILLKYKRNKISRPTVERKYRNDVNRRTAPGRKNANYHSRMNYKQYQRDELFRTSGMALVIQSVFLMITAVVFAIILYNIAISIYGVQTEKWGEEKSIFVLAGTYILALIGMAYVYEPLVKNFIVGKPKRSK
ncbi:MAG: DnaJ domain-containing protein [Crocinitomicaceae bacterium]|nr:DnaJ domain-containing protein [Crocinitomicaceae bacterium]